VSTVSDQGRDVAEGLVKVGESLRAGRWNRQINFSSPQASFRAKQPQGWVTWLT